MISVMLSEKSKSTKNLGLYVAARLFEELRKLADADGRTLSAYVRIVLEKHVERRTRRAA